MSDSFRFRTEGELRLFVRAYPGPCACGEITNGVAFDNGRGAWVMDYDDLVTLMQRAKEIREAAGREIGGSE